MPVKDDPLPFRQTLQLLQVARASRKKEDRENVMQVVIFLQRELEDVIAVHIQSVQIQGLPVLKGRFPLEIQEMGVDLKGPAIVDFGVMGPQKIDAHFLDFKWKS